MTSRDVGRPTRDEIAEPPDNPRPMGSPRSPELGASRGRPPDHHGRPARTHLPAGSVESPVRWPSGFVRFVPRARMRIPCFRSMSRRSQIRGIEGDIRRYFEGRVCDIMATTNRYIIPRVQQVSIIIDTLCCRYPLVLYQSYLLVLIARWGLMVHAEEGEEEEEE